MSKAVIGVAQNFARTAFEVGLSFDPILNVPFIPGSEIKGAVRHGWRIIVPEDIDRKLELIVFGPEVGGERSTGIGALFLDYYPIRVENQLGRLLLPDVLTPHYPEDELDVVFRGFIALTPLLELGIKEHGASYSLQKIAEDLVKTLIFIGKLGLGARTSVEYGRFEVVGVRMHVR